jgi:hypothetical protein
MLWRRRLVDDYRYRCGNRLALAPTRMASALFHFDYPPRSEGGELPLIITMLPAKKWRYVNSIFRSPIRTPSNTKVSDMALRSSHRKYRS